MLLTVHSNIELSGSPETIATALARQRRAGTAGRLRGHEFEEQLAASISAIGMAPLIRNPSERGHLVTGNPASKLLQYILNAEAISETQKVEAWWTGGLATSGLGHRAFGASGTAVSKTKSDIIIEIQHSRGVETIGVGVKTCFNSKPTNAQLYFGTAVSFCRLLRQNGFAITQDMEVCMRMFCGDNGYRPIDSEPTELLASRLSDPTRWFWEETPQIARMEWERLLNEAGGEVARALLQKAYASDPIEPQYLLHLRHGYEHIDDAALAIYSIDEFVSYTQRYGKFSTRPYRIRKGSFKNDSNEHLAPRFGVVQFQRGGQKQHPTQLQFNLKSGYFYSFPEANNPDA